jgi:hypothetical protein
MKQILCFLLIGFSFSMTNLFSQGTSNSKNTNSSSKSAEDYSPRVEMREYKMQYNFAENVDYLYKMNVKTEVVRTFSDNTTQKYEREMEIHISFRRPSGLEDGFAKIWVGYDSILYKFSDGKYNAKWFSHNDDDRDPKVADFDIVFPIMGSSYISIISPYFEVAKIEGIALEESRTRTEKITDSVNYKIWKKYLSDDNLNFYSDMNKNVIRNGRFALDSTWIMRFTIPIEGIRYTCDTATVKFYLYDGKNFHIKAEMPKMYANTNDSATVIGLDRNILPVDTTSFSSGFWDISVSPRGMINTVEGEFSTKANMRLNKTEFSDAIKTKIKYEYVSSKRWKNN